MDEEQSAWDKFTGVFKGFAKSAIKPTIIVVLILAICIPLFWSVTEIDANDVTEITSSYTTTVNSEGKIVYKKAEASKDGNENAGENNTGETGEEGEEPTDELDSDAIAEELADVLSKYILNGDKKEQIKYLMDTEEITKMPYIDPASLPKKDENEGGDQQAPDAEENEDTEEDDDEPLIGTIHFYRYNESNKNGKELTYKTPTEFNALKAAFEHDGDETIFKHFTIDEEANVVVAYGTEETRKITTKNGISTKEDHDLTIDVVNEHATETYDGNDGEYTFKKYYIYERKIDYLSLVEQYVMPANLLYSLLIQTRDIDFVKEIADTARENDIKIGIHDNKNDTHTTEVYTYNKMLDIEKIETEILDNADNNKILSDLNLEQLSTYSKLPYKCSITKSGNSNIHNTYYQKHTIQSSGGNSVDIPLYIKEDNDGKIEKLVEDADDASEYKVTYKKDIIATSTPTVGVTYADTWISKWTVSYEDEDANIPTSNTGGSLESVKMADYTDINSFYSAFTNNDVLKLNGKSLDKHAFEDLKKPVIDIIINESEKAGAFKVSAETYTKNSLNSGQIRTALNVDNRHNCSNCKHFSTDELYNEYIEIKNGKTGSSLESCIDTSIDNYVFKLNEQANINATNDAKDNKEKARKELGYEDNSKGLNYSITASASEEYTNIKFKSTIERKVTTYKKAEPIRSENDDGKKFKKVFDKKEYYEDKEAMIERQEWFWRNIRKNEDTAKLEDILRYLLNIATDSEVFGTFTADDIANLFKAFEPKEEMLSATSSGMQLLYDYIYSWENATLLNYINDKSAYTTSVQKYINEEKTMYYVYDDGAGNPTVGFGIAIFNGGFVDRILSECPELTEEQLKDMSGKTQIPVEFIDSLSEKRIQEDLKAIETLCNGLELKLYQKYALVSRRYNCGAGGVTNFPDNYELHYNFEEDDMYGDMRGDENNELFTKYMKYPNTSNGEFLKGLENRRRSEWTLFQTGYMDKLDKWVSAGDILSIAEELHNSQLTWTYGEGGRGLKSNNIELSINNPDRTTVCSTYVTSVIYLAGYATEEQVNRIAYNGCGDLYRLLQNTLGWQRIEVRTLNDLQPGDIVIMSEDSNIETGTKHHTNIHIGDGYFYDAGSTKRIQLTEPDYCWGWMRNDYIDIVAFRP